MIKRLFIISFVSVLALAGSGNYDTNAKIKAVYIYNFTKYIEWPQDYRQETFIIGVLGETPLIGELNKMAASKKVLGQTIVIKKYASSSEIKKCHILFIPSGSNTPFSSVVGKIKDYSTLLVTDTPGLALKGSAINFVIMQNRQKFELNESNAAKYKLKVSNSFKALAILVK